MTLPTRNSQLALRRADFRTVPEMLDYAAQGETGVTFYSVRGEILSASSWREIRERAHVTARRLIGAGFAPGERILITADTWPAARTPMSTSCVASSRPLARSRPWASRTWRAFWPRLPLSSRPCACTAGCR